MNSIAATPRSPQVLGDLSAVSERPRGTPVIPDRVEPLACRTRPLPSRAINASYRELKSRQAVLLVFSAAHYESRIATASSQRIVMNDDDYHGRNSRSKHEPRQ